MQSFIRGRWRSFVGETVGGFYVSNIASQVRPNRDGSPRYDVRCNRCLHYDIRSQGELTNAANGATMLCSNHTCAASFVQHGQGESLSDLRRLEAEERAAKEREEKARQAEAEKQAERDSAQRAEKSRWRSYATALFNSGVEIDSPEWVTFERWCNWSPFFRTELLERLEGSNGIK